MAPSTKDMGNPMHHVTSFPELANQVSSLPQEIISTTAQYDDIYARDPYIVSQNYGLGTFLDVDSSFDQQHMPIGTSCNFPIQAQVSTAFAPHIPAIHSSSAFRPRSASTGSRNLSPYTSDLYFHPMSMGQGGQAYYPLNEYTPSRTPSLCSDEPHGSTDYSSFGPRIMMSASPHPSSSPRPTSTAQSASTSQPSEPTEQKRGRSLLDRSSTIVHTPNTFTSTTKIQRSRRLPHNQIERRYREGLHSEFERLRRAVPSLSQTDDGSQTERLKPTKAMVFSRAVEYIRRLEKEIDTLRVENDKLKSGQAEGINEISKPSEDG